MHVVTHSANGSLGHRALGSLFFTVADGRDAVRPAVASAWRVVHEGREPPRAGSVMALRSSSVLRANNPPSPCGRRTTLVPSRYSAMRPHSNACRMCALPLHTRQVTTPTATATGCGRMNETPSSLHHSKRIRRRRRLIGWRMSGASGHRAPRRTPVSAGQARPPRDAGRLVCRQLECASRRRGERAC